MELEFKELAEKDYKKVIQYAIKGMHFNFYVDNKTILNFYGRYFWYLELLNATQVLALYYGEELAGVLIAEIYDEPKCHKSFSKSIYVKFVEFIQKYFFKDSVGIYDEVNQKLLKEYQKREKGKEIYLFTDDQCTYQFYENRGFDKVGEEDIILKLEKEVPLKCLLYRKKL